MTKKPKIAAVISCGVLVVLVALSALAGYFNKKHAAIVENVSASRISPSDAGTLSSSEEENRLPSEINTAPVVEKVKKNYARIKYDTYVRKKASGKADTVALITRGAEAEYTEESGAYVKVKYAPYKEGWVLKTGCELFEKEIEITHVPEAVTEDPFDMNGTAEGEKLGGILNRYNAVGASVAVIKDGRVTYHYEYGYADREKKISVAENTKFRVASLSKVFTAMLAMTEVDDGKLDLDGDLSEVFGRKFRHPKYNNLPITARMLLTHTAGLSGKEGLYREPLLNIINKQEYYTNKPGGKFLYSNLSIGIAGAVVEKAADQTISQYARDRFFAPMGIDASFDAQYLSDKSLVANCYNKGTVGRSNEELTRPQEGKLTKPGDIYHLGQGGLLISSVDLARVVSVLVNQGQYNGRQYLSEQSVSDMLAVHPVNTQGPFEQCIGIRKYNDLIGNRDIYYHNGAFYGILALLAVDPSDGSGVVVITSGARSARKDNTIFEVCNDVLAYCYKELI